MKFVRLFGQWYAVPMRYASLPPALVRGVAPVRLSGAGGSSSPAYPSQKSAKYKNGKHRKIMLFYALLPEIRTPPGTSVRYSYYPPRKRGGQGIYPPAHLNCPPNSNLSRSRITPPSPFLPFHPQKIRGSRLAAPDTQDFIGIRRKAAP